MSREPEPSIGFGAAIRFVAGHWRPYRGQIARLLLLTAFNGLLVAATPLALRMAVDAVVAGSAGVKLARAVLLVFVAGSSQVAVYVLLVQTRVRMNLRFDHGVRVRAAEHMLAASRPAVGAFRTGDLVTRLTDDVSEKLAWFMCSGVFRLFEALAVLAAGAVAMVQLDPVLAACALAPLPLLFLVFLVTSTQLEERAEELQRSISHGGAALESCLSGMRVVKAFGAEPLQRDILLGAVERQRRAEVSLARWQGIVETLYGHGAQVGLALVLWVGGAAVLKGNVSLGTLVAFDAWVVLLLHPIMDLGQFLVRGRQSLVSVARIAEIESLPRSGDAPWPPPPVRPPELPLAEDPACAEPPRMLTIRYDGVGFAHAGSGRGSLRELSFEARPGTITALTGPVGAGKSTALGLAVRLDDPGEGRILAGGKDVRTWDPAALRRAVALVPQEAMLLSATIADNVTLGRAWVTPVDVQRAVEAAGIGDEISGFSEGLETRVGPRGVRLSGGQKQRVALARALAGRPSVLLLDDVTASLDAVTEERVWQALFGMLPSCTVIVATHRPALLARARTVVRLPGPDGDVSLAVTVPAARQDG